MSTGEEKAMNPYVTSCADLAKALSHPHRLTLLSLINEQGRTVEELASASALSFANTSQHLQQLKRHGLVQVRREGKHIVYSLSDGPVQSVLQSLRTFVDYTQEQIHRLSSDTAGSDAITFDELSERLKEGSIILLDVRPGDEFAAGHLPGAINIELDEMEAWQRKLPASSTVVAYCRGDFCMLSAEATMLLRSYGHKAHRLIGGYRE